MNQLLASAAPAAQRYDAPTKRSRSVSPPEEWVWWSTGSLGRSRRPSRRPKAPGTVLPQRAPCRLIPPWMKREVPALPLWQHPRLAWYRCHGRPPPLRRRCPGGQRSRTGHCRHRTQV